jgi:hypothetical protein
MMLNINYKFWHRREKVKPWMLFIKFHKIFLYSFLRSGVNVIKLFSVIYKFW